MKLLLTNDDGIDAPGIAVMERIAAQIAGPDGEVWTVAPSFERSGVGHCISYTNPARIEKRSERRYEVEGFPADCVLAGIYDVFDGEKPDLILSGVNRGNNSAENTLYSGTIGAAIEGALQGCKAIALSQYYGPNNADLDNQFEAAEETGVDVIRKIIAADEWGAAPYPIFYNVNFPPVPAAQVKGVKVVAQGRRKDVSFRATPQIAHNRRKYLWIHGGAQAVGSGADTDATVNIEGYTSVTPMRCDLTAHDMLQRLSGAIG